MHIDAASEVPDLADDAPGSLVVSIGEAHREARADDGRVRTRAGREEPLTGSGGRARRDGLLRLAMHLLVWVPFVAGIAGAAASGWVPIGDAGTIGVRSWDALTTYGTLVGQGNRLGIFDPGPLEYWLLAIPVHLDPLRGLIWGGALWCMVAASLTIEAARSVSRRFGGLLACAVVLALVVWMSGIALHPYWNPWPAAMFVLTTCAAGWAVMNGRRGWWPVMVVAGSIAAQAHLMFFLVAVVLVLVAGTVGAVDAIRSRGGFRWAAIGVILAICSWWAPLVQQVTSRQGNLAALLSAERAATARAGAAFGLRSVAASVFPPGSWWTPTRGRTGLSMIDQRPTWLGVAVLAVLVAIVVLATRVLHSRRLAALAGISLIMSVGAAVTYAGVPRSIVPHTGLIDSTSYLLVLMLPVGALFWIAVGAFVVSLARRSPERAMTRSSHPLLTAAAGVVLVAASILSASEVARNSNLPVNALTMRDTSLAAQRVERSIAPQTIYLNVVARNGPLRRRLALGLAYALDTRGFRPELTKWSVDLGARYVYNRQPMVQVTVESLAGGRLSVTVLRPHGS